MSINTIPETVKQEGVSAAKQPVLSVKEQNVSEKGRLAGKSQTKNKKDVFGKLSGDEERKIKDAVSNANNQLKQHRTTCQFEYHDETNRVSIKVIDRQTKKVIREIPPEETLKMVEKLWEIAGILIDKKQ